MPGLPALGWQIGNRTKACWTPGEEGLQDQRIIEAIYESARTRRPVKLAPPGKTRGPEPEAQA